MKLSLNSAHSSLTVTYTGRNKVTIEAEERGDGYTSSYINRTSASAFGVELFKMLCKPLSKDSIYKLSCKFAPE